MYHHSQNISRCSIWEKWCTTLKSFLHKMYNENITRTKIIEQLPNHANGSRFANLLATEITSIYIYTIVWHAVSLSFRGQRDTECHTMVYISKDKETQHATRWCIFQKTKRHSMPHRRAACYSIFFLWQSQIKNSSVLVWLNSEKNQKQIALH